MHNQSFYQQDGSTSAPHNAHRAWPYWKYWILKWGRWDKMYNIQVAPSHIGIPPLSPAEEDSSSLKGQKYLNREKVQVHVSETLQKRSSFPPCSLKRMKCKNLWDVEFFTIVSRTKCQVGLRRESLCVQYCNSPFTTLISEKLVYLTCLSMVVRHVGVHVWRCKYGKEDLALLGISSC